MMVRTTTTAGLLAAVLFLFGAHPTPVAGTSEPETDPPWLIAGFDQVADLKGLSDHHARVFRLYWAAFDRAPDADGALYWVDQIDRCAGLKAIAGYFTNSPEFNATYGDAIDDAAFLEVLYLNVLDRQPDHSGRSYWLDRLQRGDVDRTQLLLEFSFSSEFVATRPFPSDNVAGQACRVVDGRSARSQRVELQSWRSYATVDGLELVLPSAAVAQVGFHQSVNQAALGQAPVQAAESSGSDPLPPMRVMADRGRGTDAQGAADIAVHPRFEIRSPVTGTVLRAGSYQLYCSYRDGFVVIEPDQHVGWEVKVLHVAGVLVKPGDRVEAGVTVIAPAATVFPFRSQIDDDTAEPSWGHVHVEVIDTAIPPTTSGGSC